MLNVSDRTCWSFNSICLRLWTKQHVLLTWYIRNFTCSHECMLAHRSFIAIVEHRSHCLSPIEELSLTECQTSVSSCDRYRCILAVTGSQWSSRSAEDVIMRLKVQHSMCCHMKDSLPRHQCGLDIRRPTRMTSRESRWASGKAVTIDITSELLTTDGADESNMFVIYTR